MQEQIRVNKYRIAVLIGDKGEEKKDLETKTKTKIDIDSHTGEVFISSDNNFYDIYLAKKIILAISRGFSPTDAYLLFDDEYEIEVLNLEDYVKNTKKRFHQIKARVIGTDGKVKKMIEGKTESKIQIYGKTVSIISTLENLKIAKEVIESILGGAKLTTIFKKIKKDQESFEYEKTDTNKLDEIDF